MKYHVVNTGDKDKAAKLAAALAGKDFRELTVYVVGVDDTFSLANILAGTEELDVVALAQHTCWIETIGKPDGIVNEADLVRLAHQRIKELEAKHGQ